MQVHYGSQLLANMSKFRRGNKFHIILNDIDFQIFDSYAFCLSQKIQAKIQFDDSMNSYKIQKYVFNNQTIQIFTKIINDGEYNGTADLEAIKELYDIGCELECPDLITPYTSIIDQQKINEQNVKDHMHIYVTSGNTAKIEECIKYITSNFWKFDQNFISELNFDKNNSAQYYDIIERILIDPDLTVKSEDQFANSILSLTKKSEIFKNFLELIKIEFCSKDVFMEILSLCTKECNDPIVNCALHLVESFLNKNKPNKYPRKIKENEKIPESILTSKNEEQENRIKSLEQALTQSQQKIQNKDRFIQEQNHKIQNLERNNKTLLETVKNYEKKIAYAQKAADETQKQQNYTILQSIPKNDMNQQRIYDVLEDLRKKNNDDALRYAVQNGYVDVMNGNGDNILHFAAMCGNHMLVKKLAELGAQMNCLNNNKRSVLWIFVCSNCYEGAEFMASHYPNLVNMPNADGQKPINVALTPQMKQMLMRYGAA